MSKKMNLYQTSKTTKKTTNKKGINSKPLIILLCVFGICAMYAFNLNKKRTLMIEKEALLLMVDNVEYQKVYQEHQNLTKDMTMNRAFLKQIDSVNETLDSYQDFSGEELKSYLSLMPSGVTLDKLTIQQNQLTIGVSSSSTAALSRFVSNIKLDKYERKVHYSGYQEKKDQGGYEGQIIVEIEGGQS